MTTPEMKVTNVGGGGAAAAGLVETIDLPEPFLCLWCSQASPFRPSSWGGTWALGRDRSPSNWNS